MITSTADPGSFYVGDEPTASVTIELDIGDDSEDILDAYTGVSYTLTKPDGTNAGSGTGTRDDLVVTIPWPGEFSFTETGVYRLSATLTGTGATLKLTSVFIVSQTENGWHTLESARDQWADAVQTSDAALWELLETAKGQCIEYAPPLILNQAVPVNYKAAQLKQAQNTWNGSHTDTGGRFNEEGGTITVFPMDWQVTNMLRPKSAIPVI